MHLYRLFVLPLWITLAGYGLTLQGLAAEVVPSEASIQFDREVLPLLSDKCFACHGPDGDARQGGLRLDRLSDATAKSDSGQRAIVPGDPAASELLVRVDSSAGDAIMPPEGHAPLTPSQIETLRAWIRQGAHYQDHWAFQPVTDVAPPVEYASDWTQTEIDLFVAREHAAHGLNAREPADPRTLVRRVSLDLTGMPPDPTDVERLAANWSQANYLAYVDRLLASPLYGQRMATPWLDAARYADTNGYQHDNGRDMWVWRDWVVDALNQNMPFDQFTIEQLAGDLLPNATLNQRIATGFNRNHGLNFEGGSIAAESQSDYVVDRTNTFASVWLGLTLSCAQCHDHKFDPISQTEYYGLFAFFNNIDEEGFAGTEGNAEPKIPVPWPEHDQRLLELERRLAMLQQELDERLAEYDAGQQAWEHQVLKGQADIPEIPNDTKIEIQLDSSEELTRSGDAGRTTRVVGELQFAEGVVDRAARFDGQSYLDFGDVCNFDSRDAFTFGAWVQAGSDQAGPVLGRIQFHGYDLVWENGHIRADFVNRWDINAIFVKTRSQFLVDRWYHVMVSYDGTSKAEGVRIYVDGVLQETEVLKDDLTGSIASDTTFFVGARNSITPGAFIGLLDDVRVYPRRLSAVEVAQIAGQAPLAEYVRIPPPERSRAQQLALREYYLCNQEPAFNATRAEQTRLQHEYFLAREHRLTTMVMRERAEPRVTWRLNAGRYDARAEAVAPHVPAVLPPLGKQQPPNRLTLARWLVSGSHPLTARVAVNRYWQLFFGRGLVETPEDFGLQGARPSHPELLDWMASQFVLSGWDVKAMHRRIVASATYQQASVRSAATSEIDPENRWLSRQSRRRMPAEMLRDTALAAADLIEVRCGGPGVMPPQPPGLWEELSFLSGHTSQQFEPSTGGDAVRRSLYTYWKRSCPPPNMQVFDAAERAVCSVRRESTNTPLQALVLLNDPVFIQPALELAVRASSSDQIEDAIDHMFRRLLARPAREEELVLLTALYHKTLASLGETAARDFLKAGHLSLRSSEAEHQPRAIAALAAVAQIILAMDEAITIN